MQRPQAWAQRTNQVDTIELDSTLFTTCRSHHYVGLYRADRLKNSICHKRQCIVLTCWPQYLIYFSHGSFPFQSITERHQWTVHCNARTHFFARSSSRNPRAVSSLCRISRHSTDARVSLKCFGSKESRTQCALFNRCRPSGELYTFPRSAAASFNGAIFFLARRVLFSITATSFA